MTTDGIDYEAVLADLEERKARIEAAIQGIKAMRGGTDLSGAIGASTDSTNQNGAAGIQSDTFFGLTIPDAAIKCLRIIKAKQSTAQIAKLLETGGMKHLSQNLAASVHTALFRLAAKDNPPVVKVGRGEWGLKEWYPGAKNSKKIKVKAIVKAKKKKKRRVDPGLLVED